MLFPRRWKRKRSPATGPPRHDQGWTLGSPWDATETPTIVDAAHARGVSSNSPPPGDQTRPATTGRPGPSPNPDAGQDITAPAVREPDRLVPPGPMTVQWHPDGTGPVPTVAGPVRHRPRKVLTRTLDKAWGDSLFGLSSQAAFWSALSTPPLLLALLGMVGYIAHLFGPGTMTDIHAQITVFLHTIFNPEVADLVGNTVDTILNNGQADVVSIGLIISLWAGSSAMSAFIESITIAYGQHEFRHPVMERLFALGLYLVALASGILLIPLLAIGPDALPRPRDRPPAAADFAVQARTPTQTRLETRAARGVAGRGLLPHRQRRATSVPVLRLQPRADLRCARHPHHVPAVLLLRRDGHHPWRPIQQRAARVLPTPPVPPADPPAPTRRAPRTHRGTGQHHNHHLTPPPPTTRAGCQHSPRTQRRQAPGCGPREPIPTTTPRNAVLHHP